MKWFLVAWVLQNGQWMQGDHFDGWSSMERTDEQHCIESMTRANKLNEGTIIKFTCEQMTDPSKEKVIRVPT